MKNSIESEQERKRIGKMLADLRESKGMSQTEAADLAGIKQQSLSRIERGLFDMKVETIAAILEVYGKRIEFGDDV